MTARALVAGGACAMLVPVLSALPPSPPRASSTRALASIVEAQAAHADLPVRSTRVERRDAAAGLAQTVAAIQCADGGGGWLRPLGRSSSWASRSTSAKYDRQDAYPTKEYTIVRSGTYDNDTT